MPDTTGTFSEAPSPEELAAFALNDLGNAMRLIRLASGAIVEAEVDTGDCTLLYLMGQGWIGFNGRYWDVKFGEALARKLAHQVALTMAGIDRGLIMQQHAIDLNKLRSYVDSLGSAGSTSAMLKQAESYLTVEIDAFDNHPMALNCMNGTVWLKMDVDQPSGVKATLKAHRPGDRLTRMIATDYNAKAKAPVFEQVVARSLRERETRDFFQRALGYSLTGHVYEQAFFLCQGKGGDGKSTLLDAAREVMGGLAEVGKIESFLDTGQTSGSSAQPDIVKLAGDVRLVLLSEPPRGAKLAEGLIKAWTGGAPISARTLNAKPFDFKPKGRLWWECNALPVIKGDDEGIWRRANIIMFKHRVPKEEMDKQLPEKLRKEFSGILNWMIAGVGDWLARGLDPPEEVTKALEDYRKQSSPFGDWLNECCIWGEAAGQANELSTVLYACYKQWVADQGGDDKPMSLRAFGDALMQRQIMHGPRRGDGKKTRAGIKLRDEFAYHASGTKPAEKTSAASATDALAAFGNDGFSDLGYPE